MIFQADSDGHRHLVQDPRDAANRSWQTDGSASKGHQTDEQGIATDIGISIENGIGIAIDIGIGIGIAIDIGIGIGNAIGIDNQKDIKVGSFGDPIFTFQSW